MFGLVRAFLHFVVYEAFPFDLSFLGLPVFGRIILPRPVCAFSVCLPPSFSGSHINRPLGPRCGRPLRPSRSTPRFFKLCVALLAFVPPSAFELSFSWPCAFFPPAYVVSPWARPMAPICFFHRSVHCFLFSFFLSASNFRISFLRHLRAQVRSLGFRLRCSPLAVGIS